MKDPTQLAEERPANDATAVRRQALAKPAAIA
jgi:hypothetical protein